MDKLFEKINGQYVISTLELKGMKYYITEKMDVYTKQDEYTLVTDDKVIKNINIYVNPKSLDIV